LNRSISDVVSEKTGGVCLQKGSEAMNKKYGGCNGVESAYGPNRRLKITKENDGI
jgi:hypothetical protein